MDEDSKTKHSSFWGIMVIAGTVIGGGMFALPVDLAGAGFLGRIYSHHFLVFNAPLRTPFIRSQS